MKDQFMNYLEGNETSPDFLEKLQKWNALYIEDKADKDPNNDEFTETFITIIHETPRLACTPNANLYALKYIAYFEALCENVELENIIVDRDMLMEIMTCVSCEELNPCSLFLKYLHQLAIEYSGAYSRDFNCFRYCVARVLKEKNELKMYEDILACDERLRLYFATHKY